MSYATIDDLRSHLGKPRLSPEYEEKMMHPIPEAHSVNRVDFILQRCRGKRVLEFGSSGHLQKSLLEANLSSYRAIDKVANTKAESFDLDDVTAGPLPQAEVDLIVCGEILEHLANPGYFLQRLKEQFQDIPVILTVPNAFTKVGRSHLANGRENVNSDHVCWYSYKTLKTLVERYGFTVDEFYYYGGRGPEAQGLVMVIH